MKSGDIVFCGNHSICNQSRAPPCQGKPNFMTVYSCCLKDQFIVGLEGGGEKGGREEGSKVREHVSQRERERGRESMSKLRVLKQRERGRRSTTM